ncbi:hypothetical protein [Methylobacterium sp. ID0610]|uniref:hypothetical protein n=1 Tax=Methylobacterium carpenticola TaxID=3344827 RepID=UPI0036BD527A
MSSPLLPLIVTAVFAAGLFVITRLERWANLVGGVLGVTAVGLFCVLLMAVTPPTPAGDGRARTRAPGSTAPAGTAQGNTAQASTMPASEIAWIARP